MKYSKKICFLLISCVYLINLTACGETSINTANTLEENATTTITTQIFDEGLQTSQNKDTQIQTSQTSIITDDTTSNDYTTAITTANTKSKDTTTTTIATTKSHDNITTAKKDTSIITTIATTTVTDAPTTITEATSTEPIIYNDYGDVIVNLNEDTAHCNMSSVIVNGSTVTITEQGSYEFSGNLNGQIVVNTSKDSEVILKLNGVNISNSDGSAIFVESADKVKVNSNANTDNYLYDGGTSNACIYSKDDVTLKGEGTLNINGNIKNGVYSKNTLKVTGGNINVYSVNNALVGKDEIKIEAGNINITNCKDGIKTTNEEDTTKGYLTICGGTMYITAEDDAIQSTNGVDINNCYIAVNVGGKQVNCDNNVYITDGCIFTMTN